MSVKIGIISDKLADAISLLRDIEKEYSYFREMLSKQEKKETDLMHFLELDKGDYSSRAKIATQLRDCLQERRYYKDQVEERQPIAQFLTDPQNKKLLDSLGRVLGEVRKAENYHKNRTYSPRVLRQVEIEASAKT